MTRITLNKNEERRIKSGHPWVFSNEIREVAGERATGIAAELYDAKAFPSRIEQDVLPTEIETGSRVRLPSTLFHFCGPPDFPYTTDIVQLENPASNDTVSRRAKPLKTAVPTRVLP